MGCDIHLYVEVKENDEWKGVLNPANTNDYVYDHDNDEEIAVPGYRWGFDRNYFAFGILAGVRSSLECIYPERGLPSDICQQIKLFSDMYGPDGHTHSYLSLSELKTIIDANQSIRYAVDYENYKLFKNGYDDFQSVPSWIAKQYTCITNEQMDLYLEYYAFSNNEKFLTYVRVNPSATSRDYKEELREVYNDILSLSKGKEARIVFWFDN